MTRYADDLCFSTDQAYFPHHLAYVEQGETKVGEAVVEIVERNGFEINSSKTRLMRRTQRQRVTGMVVNEKVNVSRSYVRDLRNLLYIWQQHGEADAIEAWQRKGGVRNVPPGKPPPRFAQVVRGRVQHVGSIKGWTSSTYLKLAAVLDNVDDGFSLRHKAPPPAPPERRVIRLLTEGPTDVQHMLAAQRRFHAEGRFLDLELVIDEQSVQRGDRRLLQTCEGLGMTPQPTPCLCLFDRDNEDILKKAVGEREWKDWTNGVIALALVAPQGGRTCIEMLYDAEARAIEDEEGRRLFLMSEFDHRSGLHESGKFTTPYPAKKKLVPESVYAVEDNRSVGLTKVDFASAVWNEAGRFEQVSFEGFKPTFEAIREAVRAVVPQPSD